MPDTTRIENEFEYYALVEDQWRIDDAAKEDWSPVTKVGKQCCECIALQRMDVKGSWAGRYRCALGLVMKECYEPVSRHENAQQFRCRECLNARKRSGDCRNSEICLSFGHDSESCSLDAYACRKGLIRTILNQYDGAAAPKAKEYPPYAEMDKKMVRQFLMEDYPIKPEWLFLTDELNLVYKKRLALWEGNGFKDRFTFSAASTMPKELIDILPYVRAAGECLSFSMSRDLRKKILNKSLYRLNLAPGAIISAAQKGGSLSQANACLGANKEYEGTAAQMAFDPYLAVIEPVNDRGIKEDGFQFVCLDPKGMLLYGGLYTGSHVGGSEGFPIMEALVRRSRKYPIPNWKEHNAGLQELEWLIETSTGNSVDVEKIRVEPQEEKEDLEELRRENIDSSWLWRPIRNVPNAYHESCNAGLVFTTDIKDIMRPYDRDDIERMIREAGCIQCVGRGELMTCENCDDTMEEDDAWNGTDWGVPGLYCCESCVRSAQEDAASSWNDMNGTCVINGETYDICY